MKFITNAALVLLFAVVVVALQGGTPSGNKAAAQALPQNQTQTQTSSAAYAYTAQPGDAYSQMARKAVQTYGKKLNVSLNQAQIIYAETNLTQEAASPLLEVGQKVELKEATVKQWVDKAKTLSASDQTAWNYYAQFVDFNTDAVGQAR